MLGFGVGVLGRYLFLRLFGSLWVGVFYDYCLNGSYIKCSQPIGLYDFIYRVVERTPYCKSKIPKASL